MSAPLISKPELRKRLAQLREKWIAEQLDYPPTPEGLHASAAVRLCADELIDLMTAPDHQTEPQ